MGLLQLEEGALVRTPDGDKVGTIDRFVVNPATSEVTHVVVREGVFFPDDRVLPVEKIDHVDDQGPVVARDVSPEKLPRYEMEHYAPVDPRTEAGFDATIGPASMWRFPMIATGLYPGYPVYAGPTGEMPPREVKRAEVPGSGVLIDDDTPVMSADGESVGKVTEVYLDDEQHLSHLVVDLGMLSGRRVLPAHWISAIREDQVTLAVAESALESLPEAVE